MRQKPARAEPNDSRVDVDVDPVVPGRSRRPNEARQFAVPVRRLRRVRPPQPDRQDGLPRPLLTRGSATAAGELAPAASTSSTAVPPPVETRGGPLGDRDETRRTELAAREGHLPLPRAPERDAPLRPESPRGRTAVVAHATASSARRARMRSAARSMRRVSSRRRLIKDGTTSSICTASTRP